MSETYIFRNIADILFANFLVNKRPHSHSHFDLFWFCCLLLSSLETLTQMVDLLFYFDLLLVQLYCCHVTQFRCWICYSLWMFLNRTSQRCIKRSSPMLLYLTSGLGFHCSKRIIDPWAFLLVIGFSSDSKLLWLLGRVHLHRSGSWVFQDLSVVCVAWTVFRQLMGGQNGRRLQLLLGCLSFHL